MSLLKIRVGGSDYLCKWNPHSNEVKIGGRWYPYVQIGRQLWLAENLDWKFSGLTISDQNSTNPTGCYFNNDESTYGIAGNKYGLLYNWYAARYIMDNQLVADWRVPNNDDFTNFKNAVPDVDYVKSTFGWNNDFNGTNDLQFNGVSTGYRSSLSNYHFYGLGDVAPYWGIESGSSAYSMNLEPTSIQINHSTTNTYKLDSYCIRLCKDATVNIGGRDYPTTRIGNQIWLAENLDWKLDGITINGGAITETPAAWYFNEDEATYGVNGNKHGLLYNKLCQEIISQSLPNGWRIPSKSDFEELDTYIGSNSAIKLKSTTGWPNNYKGTDNFGFTLLPSGWWDSKDPRYSSNVANCPLQTSTPYSTGRYWQYYTDESNSNNMAFDSFGTAGIAIRLVKDVT